MPLAQRPGLAAAGGRVDARELLRPPRDARPVAVAAGVGGGEAVPQLGLRVRRARPRAAPGRPRAARGARARAAPADLRQLARPRRPAVDRHDPPPPRPLPGRPLQARRRGGVDARRLRGPRRHRRGRRRRLQGPVRDGGRGRRRRSRAMYERVVATFPDAILEDPHDLPEVAGPLAPHAGRVSYDALIHSVDDLATTPVNPIRTVNIKPCRTGGLRALLALYAHCEAEGIADVRRRDGRERRRARPDPAARLDLPPRRAQRRRAERLQPRGPARGPALEPAAPGRRQRASAAQRAMRAAARPRALPSRRSAG